MTVYFNPDRLYNCLNLKFVGSVKSWIPDERLPPMSLRTALTQYLDISTPPSQTVIKQLATVAIDENERRLLETLATASYHLYLKNHIHNVTVKSYR